MAKAKEVLTTGDVARICHVAHLTVTGWLDKGLLKGYHLPLSGHRRIEIPELVRFMKEYDIPIPDNLFPKSGDE
jgi:hypothetical protein